MEEAISFAKKYLEDMLSFFGLNVDVYATHDEDMIELNVPSTHMNGFLIGQHGDTMRSLQYLVMSALKNNDFEFTRVNVDVADYKKARNERLAEQAEKWMGDVKANGKAMELRPMSSSERRVVHQVASDYGLTTESIGMGHERRVVIQPPTDSEPDEEESKTASNEPEAEAKEEKAKQPKKPAKTSAKKTLKKTSPKKK